MMLANQQSGYRFNNQPDFLSTVPYNRFLTLSPQDFYLWPSRCLSQIIDVTFILISGILSLPG